MEGRIGFMPEQWYVWLVGCYPPSVPHGETGPWEVRGIFSSHDKAKAAAITGDFIIVFAVNDAAYEHYWLPVEWVE